MSLLLSPDHSATLTDPHTWSDNPFVIREQRRDTKKLQPFLSFCWMCGILLLLGGLAARGLWAILTWVHYIPWFVGGDVGTSICVIVSGIQIWFIAGAAQKHTTRLFSREANQNTLSGLLLLPSSPFQLMVQAMVYPWIVSMRMAFAMLPVYVFCVGMDGPTWVELLSLYVVFAMTALLVPFWQRPALSENAGVVLPSGTVRTARVRPVRGGPPPQRTASGSGMPGGILAVAFVIPIFASAATRSLGGYSLLTRYLPPSIVALMTSSLISWPLMMARLMVAPLDWFGVRLIPLPFILVFFLINRYVQVVRASEFLSVGAYRDLPLQATYVARRRLEGVLRFAQAFAFTGYLWKWGVLDGGLSFLYPYGAGSMPGLGGFAVVVCLATGIWGMSRGSALATALRRPWIPGERNILRQTTLLKAVRFLAMPSLGAIIFFFAACLLSRSSPFAPVNAGSIRNVWTLFWQMWAIGLGGTLLSFGLNRISGYLGAIPHAWLNGALLLSAYFQSREVRQLLAGAPQTAYLLTVMPAVRRLEVFSPTAGLLHLAFPAFANGLLPNPPVWWSWPLLCGAVGAITSLLGTLLGQKRALAPTEDAVTLVFDPTEVGREAFLDPVIPKQLAIVKGETFWVQQLIFFFQSYWDNAILTREMRARLRGKSDHRTLLLMLACATGGTLLFFHPWLRQLPQAFGGWAAFLIIGPSNGPVAQTAAGVLGIGYLILLGMGACFSFATAGTFYLEAQKSTLDFLLTTPMRSRDIVLGKAAGILITSFTVLTGITLWLLSVTVLFLPLLGPIVLIGFFETLLTVITIYLSANVVSLAISALFPRASQNLAGWIWLIFFVVCFFPLLSTYGSFAAGFMLFGLQGAALWAAFIAVGWLVIIVGYFVAVAGIESLRKRDLTFATPKRAA